MKKGIFIMMVAVISGLASCTSPTHKGDIKNGLDSLSYMMGISGTGGLMQYAQRNLGVDSANFGGFIKGIEQGTKIKDAKEKAYLAGIQIGQQVSNDDAFQMLNNRYFAGAKNASFNKDLYIAGFLATLKKEEKISLDSAANFINIFGPGIKADAMEKEYTEYKKENEEFLAKNKEKGGIKTTPSGLQYRIITEGKGAIPTDSSRVKVNYKGTLIDGTEFDNSYDRKRPLISNVDKVIKGWQEALTMMPVGSKWEIFVPQELGYGASQTGRNIKPFSTLIFEIELLNIEK